MDSLQTVSLIYYSNATYIQSTKMAILRDFAMAPLEGKGEWLIHYWLPKIDINVLPTGMATCCINNTDIVDRLPKYSFRLQFYDEQVECERNIRAQELIQFRHDHSKPSASLACARYNVDSLSELLGVIAHREHDI